MKVGSGVFSVEPEAGISTRPYQRRIEMKIKTRGTGLMLAAAALLMTPAVGENEGSLVQRIDTLQAKVDNYLAQDEEREQIRSDEAYEELIHRLELGMDALKELGKEDALHHLERIADEVRKERQGARRARRQERAGVEQRRVRDEARSEIDVVRERLKVMRLAVDAYLEAGDVHAAELVELAMHSRELAIEGRRDEKAASIRERAPDREKLAGLLKRAAHLWAEWGHEKRAGALAELAQTFAEQARRRQERAARGETREPESTDGRLDDLKVRLEIVRLALGAHARMGHADARDILERLLVVGEMQAEGASDQSIAQAAEGLSMGIIIELLQRASGQFREWDMGERARACNQLAEFYARRERERAQGEAGETRAEPDPRYRREHSSDQLEQLERAEQETRKALEGIRPQHSRYELVLRRLEEIEQAKQALQADRVDRDVLMQRLADRVDVLQSELNEVKQALRKLGVERR